jgi:hypothetical protein
MSAEIDLDGNWTVDYQTINSNNFVDMRITGKWMDTIGDLGNGTGQKMQLKMFNMITFGT